MTIKFEINGKLVMDSGLYPWALGSLSRSLFFYGETIYLSQEKVATCAITTYYSIFHLSIFLLYECPHLIEDNKRTAINKRLKQGNKDPRHEISHDDVYRFVEKCSALDLPTNYLRAFKQARELREDMNYGPNVRYSSGNTIVDSCNFSIEKANQVVTQLDNLFEEAILWSLKNGVDAGIWVPIALDQASLFFKKKGFYSKWTTEENLMRAESLRSHLLDLTRVTLYP